MMENSWQTFQKELENPRTTNQRRLQIGALLAKLPDPRPGVGVKADVPNADYAIALTFLFILMGYAIHYNGTG